MSVSKYFVTYCVMTGEAGSNPFWHSCLLMSEQSSEDASIEVKDAIGFYAPGTGKTPNDNSSTTNPIIRGLKKLLGFQIDLQDGHGHLLKEKLRYLDAQGLIGVSFEVPKAQYDKLVANYQAELEDSEKAIRELDALLAAENTPINGYRRFLKERSLAKDNGVAPRLKPFHVTMDISLSGFDTTKSYTCKTRALDLLKAAEIISDDIYTQLASGKAKRAFPRFCNMTLTPFQLVSTGEPSTKVNPKTRKTYYYRDWGDQNHLFWTSTPRTLKNATSDAALQDSRHHMIKDMLKRIDNMERLLLEKIASYRKDQSTGMHFHQLSVQLKRVQQSRERFIAKKNNQDPDCLKELMVYAESMLNVAQVTLKPEKYNYSFLARVLHNISLHYALLGLLTIIAAATLLTGAMGVAVSVGASIFASYQSYKMIQTEIQHAAMIFDYTQFQKYQKQPTLSGSTFKFLGSTGSNDSPLSKESLLSDPTSPGCALRPAMTG